MKLYYEELNRKENEKTMRRIETNKSISRDNRSMIDSKSSNRLNVRFAYLVCVRGTKARD